MNKHKFIITSLFAALVLSGCKIELGDFVKQSGDFTSAATSLPPLGDDFAPSIADQGDVSANADFISERNEEDIPGAGLLVAHHGWPTAHVQTFLANNGVFDTIPNIILDLDVYIDNDAVILEFAIIVFGENPTLAEQILGAHIDEGWKEFTEEGSNMIFALNDSEEVFLMGMYLLEVTDGEDFNHPTLTMFVYGLFQDEE